MPTSFNFFDNHVREYITKQNHIKTILDIGPGEGKYGKMFRDKVVDAVEIFAPYIEQFGLKNIYRNVHNENVINFKINPDQYDLVIMGDILEHLTVDDATKVLNHFKEAGSSVLVLVPYNYEQGACFGNDHEEHLQPDLTEALFMKRYPGFTKIFGNHAQGVFYAPAK